MSDIQIKVTMDEQAPLTFPYPNFQVMSDGTIVIKNDANQPVGVVNKNVWVAVWAEKVA